MSEQELMLLDSDYEWRQQRRNKILFRLFAIASVTIITFIVITTIIGNSGPAITGPKYGPKTLSCSTSYAFDYYLFVLRWPSTICRANACLKHTNKWLIHGRWPQFDNNSWPQYCCFDRRFDVKQLSAIVDDLKSDWTNLTPNKSYDSLWRHEWVKHGTCAKTPQLDFFNTTLQIYKSLPVDDWLREHNITANNKKLYSKSEFNNVFNSKLNRSVQLNCVERDNSLMLEEIIICYNHSSAIELIDCKTGPYSDTCDRDFYYPIS